MKAIHVAVICLLILVALGGFIAYQFTDTAREHREQDAALRAFENSPMGRVVHMDTRRSLDTLFGKKVAVIDSAQASHCRLVREIRMDANDYEPVPELAELHLRRLAAEIQADAIVSSPRRLAAPRPNAVAYRCKQ